MKGRVLITLILIAILPAIGLTIDREPEHSSVSEASKWRNNKAFHGMLNESGDAEWVYFYSKSKSELDIELTKCAVKGGIKINLYRLKKKGRKALNLSDVSEDDLKIRKTLKLKKKGMENKFETSKKYWYFGRIKSIKKNRTGSFKVKYKNQLSTESVIVYSDNYGVYSTDISGSIIRSLTETFPKMGALPFFLSPDGKYVACMIHYGHSHEEGDNILIASLTDPQSESIIDLPNYYIIYDVLWWSPDSKYILFDTTYSPVDRNNVKDELHTFSIENQTDNIIYEGLSSDYYFTYPRGVWSPDSTRFYYILYASYYSNKYDELRISLADGSQEYLVASESTEYFSSTASHSAPYPMFWSPDGKKIALVSHDKALGYNSGYNNLYSVERNGENRLKIMENIYPSNADLVWSPNGKYISMNSHVRGKSDDYIRVISSDGTKEIRLAENKNSPKYFNNFRWTVENKLVSVEESSNSLIILDPESENIQRVPIGMEEEGRLISFKISPDGNYIAYYTYSTINRNSELFTVKIDGTGNTKLSNNIQSRYWGKIDQDFGFCEWAPNSKSIAFLETTNTDLPSSLYVMSVDGRNKTLLLSPGESNYYIDGLKWSRDSKFIIYLLESNARHLYSITADGSEAAVQITKPTSDIDRRHVYYFDVY